MLYGAPIWTPTLPIIKSLSNALTSKPNQLKGIITKINRVSFESVHQFFLKWALGTHKKSSNIGTLGESGRYPLIYQSIKLSLNYYQRIAQLNDDSFVKAALKEQRSLKLPWYKNLELLMKTDEIFNIDHVTAYNISNNNTKSRTSDPNTTAFLFKGKISAHSIAQPEPSKSFRTPIVIKQLREHFKECWEHDKSTSPKLEFYHHIKKTFLKEPYLDIVNNATLGT